MFLNVPADPKKKQYILVLDAGLSDVAGKTLGTTGSVEINLVPPTIARFDLLGIDGDYEDIGIYGADPDIACLHLTNRRKKVRITFNRPVNRPSVEASIECGLKEKNEKRTYEWQDDRTLIFRMDKQVSTDPNNWVALALSYIAASGPGCRRMLHFW